MSDEQILSQLKTEVADLSSVVKSLESKMSELQESISSIDTKVSPLDVKVTGILKSSAVIGKKLTNIESTTKEHSEKYDSIESALGGLRTVITNAQDFIKELETKQHKNINNIDALNKEKEALRKDLISHITNVNEQLNKVSKVCTKVDTHDDAIGEMRNTSKVAILISVSCVGIVTLLTILDKLGIWNLLAKFIQGFAK